MLGMLVTQIDCHNLLKHSPIHQNRILSEYVRFTKANALGVACIN